MIVCWRGEPRRTTDSPANSRRRGSSRPTPSRDRSVVPELPWLLVGNLLRGRTRHVLRRGRPGRLLRLRRRTAFVAAGAGAAVLPGLLLAHDECLLQGISEDECHQARTCV